MISSGDIICFRYLVPEFRRRFQMKRRCTALFMEINSLDLAKGIRSEPDWFRGLLISQQMLHCPTSCQCSLRTPWYSLACPVVGLERHRFPQRQERSLHPRSPLCLVVIYLVERQYPWQKSKASSSTPSQERDCLRPWRGATRNVIRSTPKWTCNILRPQWGGQSRCHDRVLDSYTTCQRDPFARTAQLCKGNITMCGLQFRHELLWLGGEGV